MTTEDVGNDILLERVNVFAVGERRFAIAPPSLGLTILLNGALARAGVLKAMVDADPLRVCRTVAHSAPLDACRVVALATCRTKAEAMDAEGVEDTAQWLSGQLDADEVASLLAIVLSGNKVGEWMTAAGIAAENKRLALVAKAKDNGGSQSFGAKTIFGQLIDPALERYGWTYEYCVWGVSYAALTSLLADKPTSLYLTEEECKKVPARFLDRDVINGDDPSRNEQLLSMNWD